MTSCHNIRTEKVKDLPIKDLRIIGLIKEYYTKRGNTRDLLFFLLAINTGLKINEILDLNIEDVKGKDCIVVKHCISNIKKRIPINKEIQELVKVLSGNRKSSEPLFLSSQNNRMERTCVYKNFKEMCETLGLDENISISSLRKTFGYHYYQASKDLSFLQWLFNQTTVLATMEYIDVKENLSLRFNQEFSL